ncbi:hypothetical protein P43SY_006707 [Pythium insidiosum]|uniref:RRM domain-containing protein n=1 Tax=Pythium insidiosum TaxID=114742 RepID=A0AAD5LTC8_PYTIN|nr:hypothetical protein P43SY_006707 [Pythium insidiosum]
MTTIMAPGESSVSSPSSKRALDDEQVCALSSAGGGGEKRKRARKSRWDRDGAPPATASTKSDEEPSANPLAAPAGALSEIVRRLSGVVKEKAVPSVLGATTTDAAPATAANSATAAPLSPLDVATARARALAQATKLSLSLPNAQVAPTDLAKRVYVGNLYYELKENDVRDYFAPFGSIHSIDLSMEPGYHRGYGFIEFADEASATTAIQHMNGFELAGQKLKVGKASPSAVAFNLARSTDKVLRIRGTGDADRSLVMRNKGVVVEDPDVDAVRDVAEPGPATTRSEPLRCVCLRNMVAKGDVDAELREEVSAECARFGPVERIEIQELADHVRIFVVFGAEESARKAKTALSGRYFGGNQVQADFYSLTELTNGRYESVFL